MKVFPVLRNVVAGAAMLTPGVAHAQGFYAEAVKIPAIVEHGCFTGGQDCLKVLMSKKYSKFSHLSFDNPDSFSLSNLSQRTCTREIASKESCFKTLEDCIYTVSLHKKISFSDAAPACYNNVSLY